MALILAAILVALGYTYACDHIIGRIAERITK